jgi:hypothetical protein
MKEIVTVLDAQHGFYNKFDFSNFGVNVESKEDDLGISLSFVPYVHPSRYQEFKVHLEDRLEDS